jgi:2-polyprenyl-3-methyl-5-hydroxy-6-metoxy-1,4-benzoquinol methylase
MSRSFVYKNKVAQENDPRGYAVKWIKEGSLDKSVNILDIGCACGDFGMAVLENEIKAEIWGLEYDIDSVNYSKSLDIYKDIYQTDLNNFLEEKYKNFVGYFDYIFFGDVLEHILYPEQIVKKFKSFLKKEGKIIISIPNISHASIKANILLNNFDYTEAGILDETHIKFFTYKTFVKFLTDAGLKIEKFKPTFFGPLGTQKNDPYQQLPFAIKTFISQDPHSFVIQYVVECSVEDESKTKNDNYSNNLFLIENYISKNIEMIMLYADKRIIFTKKERKRFYQKIQKLLNFFS